jgi:hypothetical protein
MVESGSSHRRVRTAEAPIESLPSSRSLSTGPRHTRMSPISGERCLRSDSAASSAGPDRPRRVARQEPRSTAGTPSACTGRRPCCEVDSAGAHPRNPRRRWWTAVTRSRERALIQHAGDQLPPHQRRVDRAVPQCGDLRDTRAISLVLVRQDDLQLGRRQNSNSIGVDLGRRIGIERRW